jgi:hypothetical protein
MQHPGKGESLTGPSDKLTAAQLTPNSATPADGYGAATPGAQHDHRIDARGRRPLPLHDARRCGQLDHGAVIRPGPGEWHPRMPVCCDRGACGLARWRDAVYQLAALRSARRLLCQETVQSWLSSFSICPIHVSLLASKRLAAARGIRIANAASRWHRTFFGSRQDNRQCGTTA